MRSDIAEYCTYLGSDRPSIKDLCDHVVNSVANKWKRIGVQLLQPDQLNVLNIIATDHPSDAVSCCKCVLEKWLDTSTGATWNQLIGALKCPNVNLDYFADKLEQKLITEGNIYVVTLCQHICSWNKFITWAHLHAYHY